MSAYSGLFKTTRATSPLEELGMYLVNVIYVELGNSESFLMLYLAGGCLDLTIINHPSSS